MKPRLIAASIENNPLLVMTEQDKDIVREVIACLNQGLNTLTEVCNSLTDCGLAVQWFDCTAKTIRLLKYEETAETFIRGETVNFDYRPLDIISKYKKTELEIDRLLEFVLECQSKVDLNLNEFDLHSISRFHIDTYYNLTIPEYLWECVEVYWSKHQTELARTFHGAQYDELDGQAVMDAKTIVMNTMMDVKGDILKALDLV